MADPPRPGTVRRGIAARGGLRAVGLLAAALVAGTLLLACGSGAPAPAASAAPQPTSALLARLRALPGVTATPIETLAGFSESIQVDYRQPVDHDDPARGTFTQRFLLSHRGEARPLVFYTSGYGIGRNFEPELSALLQANQILLVHRFFEGATPEPRDWRDLTIRQAPPTSTASARPWGRSIPALGSPRAAAREA